MQRSLLFSWLPPETRSGTAGLRTRLEWIFALSGGAAHHTRLLFCTQTRATWYQDGPRPLRSLPPMGRRPFCLFSRHRDIRLSSRSRRLSRVSEMSRRRHPRPDLSSQLCATGPWNSNLTGCDKLMAAANCLTTEACRGQGRTRRAPRGHFINTRSFHHHQPTYLRWWNQGFGC